MFKVIEVFNQVAANGVTFADHVLAPAGSVRKSMGFRIAEFNAKGQRIRYVFPAMIPFATADAAEAKLAAWQGVAA